MALPRGGIPVGAEIAAALEVPLFPFVVRKLGAPEHEDLAMGAAATDGKRLINRAVTLPLHISEHEVDLAVERERRQAARLERLYGRGHPMPEVKEKIVILVDDGVLTGSRMLLAGHILRQQGAARLIMAVPGAPARATARLRQIANEVICLVELEPLGVGRCYEDSQAPTDHEVCMILDRMYEEQSDPAWHESQSGC